MTLKQPPRHAVLTGDEVRRGRESLGWSQQELARHSGTSQQTIDRIERGETKHSRALVSIKETLKGHLANFSSVRGVDRASDPAPEVPFTMVPTTTNTWAVLAWSPNQVVLIGYTEPGPALRGTSGYTLVILTDALSPAFHQNDNLFVNPQTPPQIGDHVVASSGSHITIGRWIDADPGYFYVQVGAESEPRAVDRADHVLQQIFKKEVPMTRNESE
jgi:DNA-binding XRE family transcriptional regulator